MSGREVWSFECSDVKSLGARIRAAKLLGLTPIVELSGTWATDDGELAFLNQAEAELSRGGLYWVDAGADGRRYRVKLTPTSRIVISLRRSS